MSMHPFLPKELNDAKTPFEEPFRFHPIKSEVRNVRKAETYQTLISSVKTGFQKLANCVIMESLLM